MYLWMVKADVNSSEASPYLIAMHTGGLPAHNHTGNMFAYMHAAPAQPTAT